MLHYAARPLTSRALKIHYFIFPPPQLHRRTRRVKIKREERGDECLEDEKWCSGERSRPTATQPQIRSLKGATKQGTFVAGAPEPVQAHGSLRLATTDRRKVQSEDDHGSTPNNHILHQIRKHGLCFSRSSINCSTGKPAHGDTKPHKDATQVRDYPGSRCRACVVMICQSEANQQGKCSETGGVPGLNGKINRAAWRRDGRMENRGPRPTNGLQPKRRLPD